MWVVKGREVPTGWITLDPIRVLDDLNGPRIFLCKDVPGNQFLAYMCGAERGLVRYLVVPCDEDLERRITSGEINLRDALTNERAWICDLSANWIVSKSWQVNVDDLPWKARPLPGVMLHSNMRPVYRISTFRPCTSEWEMEYPAPCGGE